MLATQAPFSQYFDKNGDPLDAGFVYFGQPNQNPETSPISVYWDIDGTQPVAQPARTLAGYIVRNGTPARVYAEGAYSVTVRNRKAEMVYYAATSTDFSDLPVNRAVITATNGQTLVNLPFAYTRGNNSLQLFVNGLIVRGGGVDYTETTTTSVTFANGLSAGDEVEALGGALLNPANALGMVSDVALAASGGSALVGTILNATDAVAETLGDRINRDLGVSIYSFILTDAEKMNCYLGTGTADVTYAVQAAADTGRPIKDERGTFKLTDEVLWTTAGQVMRGAAKALTRFKIGSDFNLSATGVFRLLTGETGPDYKGPVFRDFTFDCYQPDSATRADYIQYPPLIYAMSQPRFEVIDVRMNHGWIGIDMPGNCGGVKILRLESGCYHRDIRGDGALDSVLIDNPHLYPFGVTANQLVVYGNDLNIGIEFARCDDLRIDGGLVINKKGMRFYESASGKVFGHISSFTFDTDSDLTMEAGDMTCGSLYFSNSINTRRAIDMTGGYLRIASVKASSVTARTDPLIDLRMNSASSGLLQISTLYGEVTGDSTVIAAANAGAGQAQLQIGVASYQRRPNVSESRPTVKLGAGSLGTLGLTSHSPKGTGTGNWLEVTSDAAHVIVANNPGGWAQSMPTGAWANMIAFGNGEGWRTFATTLTATTPSLTSATATMKYKQDGKTLTVRVLIVITTNGTGAGALRVVLPKAPTDYLTAFGSSFTSGLMLQGRAVAASTDLDIVTYANAYPGADGAVLMVEAVYETT